MVTIDDEVLRVLLENAVFAGYKACAEVMKERISSEAHGMTYNRNKNDFMMQAEKMVNQKGNNKWVGVPPYLKNDNKET